MKKQSKKNKTRKTQMQKGSTKINTASKDITYLSQSESDPREVEKKKRIARVGV